jgi:hypothetical protein
MTTNSDSGRSNADAKLSGMSAQELNELVHRLVSIRLIEKLMVPEECTPGLLQAGLRFLVDNDVTGLDIPEAAGEAIRKSLKDKLPFKPKMAS